MSVDKAGNLVTIVSISGFKCKTMMEGRFNLRVRCLQIRKTDMSRISIYYIIVMIAADCTVVKK